MHTDVMLVQDQRLNLRRRSATSYQHLSAAYVLRRLQKKKNCLFSFFFSNFFSFLTFGVNEKRATKLAGRWALLGVVGRSTAGPAPSSLPFALLLCLTLKLPALAFISKVASSSDRYSSSGEGKVVGDVLGEVGGVGSFLPFSFFFFIFFSKEGI